MRAMIADDEAVARRRLIRLLGQVEDIEVVGQAEDGMDTLAKLATLAPDVLLLDISMPAVDGLEIARLRPATAVIFTTAYERHAVTAFALEAIDYLLKPIELPRLRQALRRARARLTQVPAAIASREAPMLEALHGRSTRYIDARSISRVHTEDKLSCFRLGGRDYHVRESLNILEARLAREGFVRCHRGELINIRAVTALQSRDGATVAVLADGTEVPISRRRLPALRDALRKRNAMRSRVE